MAQKKDLWSYLQGTKKKIVMYGMGNGADKILNVCERYGITVCDFFASDGFVRGHSFHGKTVLSYTAVKEKYGRDNIIVLLSFASSLPNVLEVIYGIASECELYAPDVPVCGSELFNFEFYTENINKINEVRELLCDRRSVEVLDSVISSKLFGDIDTLKSSYSSPDEVFGKLVPTEKFEYIADLGAYNGDTLREIKPYAKHLKKAIALEPDKRNFKKLCEYAESESGFKTEAHPAAAWSCSDTLFFDGSGNRNSSLSANRSGADKDNKAVAVAAVSLDSILAGGRIDYIKYDVEGSEKEAIEGSVQSIKRNMPSLVISLYHRSGDIFELPLLIHRLFPEYKLYIRRRQYVPAWDTVLIAVAK